MEGGGWLWAMLNGLGFVVLGAAIVYGFMLWRGRRMDPTMKAAQNEVTHDYYPREELAHYQEVERPRREG